MYLSELRLWNFRKFGGDNNIDLARPHLIVPFKNKLNILVDENDSGKTAIIDAIKLVIKTHAIEWIKLEDSDFHNTTDNSVTRERVHVSRTMKDLVADLRDYIISLTYFYL